MVRSKQQTQAQEANYENVVRDTLSVSAGKSKEIVSSLAASAGLKKRKPQKSLLKFLRSCAPRESLRRTTTEASKSSTQQAKEEEAFLQAQEEEAYPQTQEGKEVLQENQKNAGGSLARRQESLKGRPPPVVANPKRGYASQKRRPL